MTQPTPPSADHQQADPKQRSIRRGEHLEPGQKPDQLADRKGKAENRQEALIDESVEETFPASDPPTAKNIT